MLVAEAAVLVSDHSSSLIVAVAAFRVADAAVIVAEAAMIVAVVVALVAVVAVIVDIVLNAFAAPVEHWRVI